MRERKAGAMLGLALEAGRLEAVVVHRGPGRLEVRQRAEAALSLDPLGSAPELVGREIRKHLDEAGLRERTCAVCIPLSWAMVLQVSVPEVPEADVAEFLQLEAERGFPYPPESLVIVTSRFRTPSGEPWATLIGVSRDHVARLEAVLLAAALRPVGFSLGLMALQAGSDDPGGAVLALVPCGRAVQLQVTCGGGIAALRSIEGVYEGEGAAAELEVQSLVRELRITLGQLPPSVRENLVALRVFGRSGPSEELAEALESSARAWLLRLERVETFPPGALPLPVPEGMAVSPALGLAARGLAAATPDRGFLPPKVSSWQRFAERTSSRKVFWAGAVAGGVAALVLGVFLIQQVLLWRWESRWRSMSARVAELEGLQANLRRYRPWFDDSQRVLSMFRRLTDAFPEDGAVVAKSVEMRSGASVTCSGTARDRQALLRALERLGTSREVADIKVEQMRGKTPLEFTFNFKWTEGTAP